MKLSNIAFIVVLGLSACGGSPPAQIKIVEAHYGRNCSAGQPDTVTEVVKAECEGDPSCSFAVSHAAGAIADPCPAQPKDFSVAYRCGEQQRTRLIADAAKKVVILSCGR
jgi:hypothetical protein